MTDTSRFRHKSFRDPLYGFIGLSEKEVMLVDTRAFRRLHRIKQLSHVYLVYPSADSSDTTPEVIGQTYGQEVVASVARPVRLSRGPGHGSNYNCQVLLILRVVQSKLV